MNEKQEKMAIRRDYEMATLYERIKEELFDGALKEVGEFRLRSYDAQMGVMLSVFVPGQTIEKAGIYNHHILAIEVKQSESEWEEW